MRPLYNYNKVYDQGDRRRWELNLFRKHNVSLKRPKSLASYGASELVYFPNWYICLRPFTMSIKSTLLKHNVLELLIKSKPFRDSAYSTICILEGNKYSMEYSRLRRAFVDARLRASARGLEVKKELEGAIRQLYFEYKKSNKKGLRT